LRDSFPALVVISPGVCAADPQFDNPLLRRAPRPVGAGSASRGR